MRRGGRNGYNYDFTNKHGETYCPNLSALNHAFPLKPDALEDTCSTSMYNSPIRWQLSEWEWDSWPLAHETCTLSNDPKVSIMTCQVNYMFGYSPIAAQWPGYEPHGLHHVTMLLYHKQINRKTNTHTNATKVYPPCRGSDKLIYRRFHSELLILNPHLKSAETISCYKNGSISAKDAQEFFKEVFL